jgi:CRP-like cAMP-binding protein/glyoxylase-like metal-dependent hydrolase (beta-lactamase superfamily II)
VSDAVIALPRGGLYVQTSAGPVQFGIPPETIKDSMSRGLAVPTAYVVPHELFDRHRGINVSECEFPAYYNYFILKRRIRLLVDDASVEARLRAVFGESLFGPGPTQAGEGEFASDIPVASRPDFAREFAHFRRGPDGRALELDTLVEFLRFDGGGRAVVGPGVEVALEPDGSYVVYDGGRELARAPARIALPRRVSRPPVSTGRPFVPPAFGVTVLGSSHGFDPSGKTTGFVLWVGQRGLLVDPPVDATELLREQGVPARLVDGVILTHCHADHDSGTFQKLLEERRVHLYTTPTVLRSFLKKYAALSGLSEDLLRRTFSFTPVTVGAPVRAHGAELWFFYTFHSIPALGFEAFYGGKSLAFSGDTLYEPGVLKRLADEGVLSPGRYADLIAFPWYHSVVLHEAGVPPLHTPLAALAALPDEAKRRLYLVHVAERDVPPELGLKVARVGLEHTLRVDVAPPPRGEAIEVLDVICAVELFRDFPLARAGEILHAARRARVAAGETVIRQGEEGDAFYIIAAGAVAVVQDGVELKTYVAGDYFGETALVLGQPRSADVVAQTDAELVVFDRYDFLYLLRGTDIPARLVRLARARSERSWEVLERNVALRPLTSAQKTQFQSFLTSRAVAAGEALWRAGEPPEAAYLVDDAEVALERAPDPPARFRAGAFVGEFDALVRGTPATSSARAFKPGRLFVMARDDLRRLFRDNPGVFVALVGGTFVE